MTVDELAALDHPSAEDAAWLDSVAPRAQAWYTEQEALLLQQGRQLSPEEMEIARRVGVQTPEKVRVVVLKEFPFPGDPALAKELKSLGFGSPQVGGFTMGYAILEKPKFKKERWLLAHELGHVGQRERMGTEAFVRRYLLEMRKVGYVRSPLEVEANAKMQETMPENN
ncbi:MAG: hypothetical protein RBU21_10640 [FCB group bacterium]|nr:hypothetical protein [FCB group bacterium]